PKNVTGVGDTPSRRRIFTCRPAAGEDEVPCAKTIISAIARQAYRRPVHDADLEDLLSVYQQGRNNTDFESGIRNVIQTLIADPELVFGLDHAPGGVARGSNYRTPDWDPASPLSFFLWSSAPDDQLIPVASQSKLRDPAVLEQQVKRMLADPKSESLSTVF